LLLKNSKVDIIMIRIDDMITLKRFNLIKIITLDVKILKRKK